jgi:uncharacterized protein YndB with AHSA1/START domain
MPVRKSDDDVIPAGNEVVSRVFGAPRDLVFEVWTKVEHFTRWFGPRGVEVFSCAIDARPGGVIKFGHRSPDGMTLHLTGTFGEVVRNERLVFTLGIVDEHGQPQRHPMFADWPLDVSIETTVTLEDAGDGTRVTVAHRVIPPEAASLPALKRWSPLAREGSMQVLDRLGEHLSWARGRKEHTT